MPITGAWKTDNYKFVGKAFEFAYGNRLNKLLPIMGEKTTNSIDYEIEGGGGYGEMEKYTGDVNHGRMFRGFKTIVVPEEFSKTVDIHYKEAKVDKSGRCRKVGMDLGNSAAMTVYTHCLRVFGNAFNAVYKGGDGKAWAASDHPVASKGSNGRTFTADPDAGTYSNVITNALSVSAITAATELMSRYTTPDGLPILLEPDTLLVSPELEAEAKKICGENSKLFPDQASNVNPYTTLKYIVIGGGKDGFSKKQWALCDRTMLKEVFNLVYITKPQVIQGTAENVLIDTYTGYADFGIGWGDARQIVFSNPA